MGPKDRGIATLYLALSFSFRPDQTRPGLDARFARVAILQLCGLLNWYAAICTTGSAFAHSLYRVAGFGTLHAPVQLSSQAIRDINFLCGVVFVGLMRSD